MKAWMQARSPEQVRAEYRRQLVREIAVFLMVIGVVCAALIRG